MGISKDYDMSFSYKILFSYQKLVKKKCSNCLKVKTIKKHVFTSPANFEKRRLPPLILQPSKIITIFLLVFIFR